jgi:acetyltransferase-like isoleucine patch superfamily enzyme
VNIGAPVIDPAAEISAQATIGAGAQIGAYAQVGAYAVIGDHCQIGAGVYIDARVRLGANVEIQPHAVLVEGLSVADGVFIGAHACFTNDLYPRAITLEGTRKGPADWQIIPAVVEYGASIGAGAVVRGGVTVGRFALVSAGAVVTRDVAPHALVAGSPARARGYVCRCAYLLERVHAADGRRLGYCPRCDLLRDITP